MEPGWKENIFRRCARGGYKGLYKGFCRGEVLMSKERQHWLDVVKGIAILFVVMGHVGSTYGGELASRSFNVFHDFIYSFHMPLFMFISGYLFVSSLEKDYRTTSLSKLLAYGIPYIVFSVIYWAMKTVGGAFVNNAVSFKDLFLIPVFPLSFMWYLYALLIMAELSLLIGRRDKRAVLVVALICRIVWEAATMQKGFTDSWVNDLILTDFIKNYIWFALGLVYGEKLAAWMRGINSHIKLCVSILGVVLLIVIAATGLSKVAFIRILWGLIGIAAIVCIGQLIDRNKCIEYLGRNTMQIYLIHGTVISLLKIISTKLHVPMWGGYCPLVYATVIAVAVPLMIYAVCKRVPALDFLFFPNKYVKIRRKSSEVK